MWSKETIKNKVWAIGIVLLAVLTIPWSDGDATFLVFALMMAIPTFFAKKNYID